MSATYSFGYWLRRRRKALDLTQAELAERVGCAKITIRRLEADERRPSKQLAELLADALAVPCEEQAAFLHAARADLTVGHLPVDNQPLLGYTPAPRPCHNLPAAVSSFVGREQEIRELRQLLATTRLLTLTGVGGAGKTRLALEVAAQAVAAYRDGVWLVDLAPLADPALVPQAVASALGGVAPDRRPLTEALCDYLRDKHLLLLLDNCEHLLAGAALLAKTLLQSCPQLQILATSREVLHISGEVSWLVPPLAVPPPQPGLPVAALAQYEAVQLFTERVRCRQTSFAITVQNAQVVAEICQRLAGLPLAIELAAARSGVLSIEQIAARVQDALGVLIGWDSTTDTRQQTLRATLDWSYNLLSQPERQLFARLSVFAGGWTLEAAEGVGVGGAVTAAEVLDVLTQLVDKSLVVVEAGVDGTVRYRLLEPVRQYAAAQLEMSGEVEAIQRAHAAYYLALAEQAEPALLGPQQAAWLAQLEQEHANLRVALQWAVEHGEAALGLRLSGALGRFWYMHGHLSEGRQWLETTLARGRHAPAALRAKALLAAGMLAEFQGDDGRAVALLDESLALFQQLGDTSGRSWALCHLGVVARRHGDYARATTLLKDSLALCQQLGDDGGRSWALHCLGWVAYDQGDRRRAQQLLAEAAGLFRDLGIHEGSAALLEEWARRAAAQAQAERAVRLWGSAEAVRVAIHEPMPPAERGRYERALATVRRHLGEARFAAAWAEGRAMTLEQAIAYALTAADATPATVPEAPPPSSPVAALTPREHEVATLVARGLTNRQIAAQLGIARRTVDAHVSSILHKLGLSSRDQLADHVAYH